MRQPKCSLLADLCQALSEQNTRSATVSNSLHRYSSHLFVTSLSTRSIYFSTDMIRSVPPVTGKSCLSSGIVATFHRSRASRTSRMTSEQSKTFLNCFTNALFEDSADLASLACFACALPPVSISVISVTVSISCSCTFASATNCNSDGPTPFYRAVCYASRRAAWSAFCFIFLCLISFYCSEQLLLVRPLVRNTRILALDFSNFMSIFVGSPY